MSLVRILAFAGFCVAAAFGAEHAGASPSSYQGYALVVTLIVLACAHGVGVAQQPTPTREDS